MTANHFVPPRPAALKALVAVACLAAATASAQNFDYKLSGHVNRILTHVDDRVQSRTFHADNVNSQTRLRFTGTSEFSPGWTAGINWEVGYTSNPSSGISMTRRSIDATFNERHAEVFLRSAWGKISAGQGDGAANGGTEVDLSGTTVIQYAGVTDIGGGFAFRDGADFGPTIGSSIGNLDFESRYDRLRYDSPKLGPVMLSGSYGTKGQDDVYELAAALETRIGDGKLATTLGWSQRQRGGASGDDETVGGSASWLHDSGINLTLAASSNDDDDPASPRRKFAYAKLGYKTGKHAVSVDHGRGSDFALAGDDADAYGVGYVYAAQKWLDLYAGAKLHRLDRRGVDFDNVRFLTTGARLRF